jgi:DNA-binding SARP family transcriptional activator/ABC-type cobalamin/Fe3+-siderophores transport system ATPase subunit
LKGACIGRSVAWGEFRVLGPLEVRHEGRVIPLGGRKQRVVLAYLLLRANQVVPAERLIDEVWGEEPPEAARNALQSYVSRLRASLGGGRRIEGRPPGYALHVEDDELDAQRFEGLVREARTARPGDPARALTVLKEALGLWRGPPLADLADEHGLRGEVIRLEELRLAALEERVAAQLALGRHDQVVGELEALVEEQPLREPLWRLLMLALYRSGRQADALLAYQRARSVLVEELGIDPGAELRQLQAAVLAQDPGLDLPPAAEATAARELPEALQLVGPVFVGRVDKLAWLRASWTHATHGRGAVVFLAGPQGIGKTRLAAELARRVHEQSGRVLYGRCTPAAHDPLQPFAQALADIAASLQDVPGAGRSSAAFGQGLADVLAGRSDRAVLLILDDLHLAQAPMLGALAGLGAAVATRRLLVLGAYQDAAATAGLARLVERLDPSSAGHRQLGPLNRDEVAKVLAIYGAEAAAREAADPVLERTGGVPLLVHQAASEWARAQAAQQVGEAAGQTASSRGRLREVQARLADDLVGLRELDEHTQQVTRLATGHGPADEEPDEGPAAVVCPYKGLARYEASDAEYFFGRERLVAELVTHLVGAGLVGVVGPSGSGKSSLVRAGLLPALADGVLPGSDRWQQVLVRPGEHPMAELADAASRRDTAGDGDGSTTTDASDQARQAPTPGPAAGKWVWRALAGAERLLLVVDQFEEVFTTCPDEGERAAFLGALTEAAWADSHVTVVVVIRADYYGHCAAIPDLADLLAANHVLVGPMRQDELRRAIELPAHRAGLRLEPGLSAAMVDEVADQPGGLPLLSCALLESWQRRHGRTLTLAAYHQAGGVRGAVARLAEHAWSGLDTDQQQTARRILLRLAGPGEGEAVVRRRVPVAEFTAGGDQGAAQVLDMLADQRLLTKSEDSVEVAHEALLREWPRLRGWLEEDVQGRALHRHLIAAAREWDESGRDPGELYRGVRLTGALDWAREHQADLNELERAFLEASRAAAEREVADARRRAEREARTSRRLRGLLAGLAGVLVLALVAGGFALALRGRAERQALVAQRQTVVAESHQSLIWARQRHVNALRSALREFYPGALAGLGTQLAEPEALAVLELAPTPEQGRRLTRAVVRRALVQAGRRRNLQTRVVAVHAALAAPQLAAPVPIEAAYGEVVAALVAMLRCLNQQVAALEQQLSARFSAHPDAAILRSQPGLGVVLGARMLGEFGDDPARYQTAKGRKAFAGTAPITRSSGLRTVVVARAACNQRLVDACYLWAFAALSASPGARRCYDAHRARGASHHQALRALGNRLVGILHGCLARRLAYQEQVVWPAAEPAA